jgi:O-Antigen ligase
MHTETGDRVLQDRFSLDLPLNPMALRNRPWVPAGLFVLLTLALLAGAPGTLRLAYPAAAVLLGLYFYIKSPSQYFTFTLWLYFLTPLARRLTDYRIGAYIDGNTMLLAPALVSFIALLALARIPRKLDDAWLSFVLLLCTVLYGGALGFAVLSDRQAVLKSLVAWLGPMAFAIFVYLNWRSFPIFKQSIDKAALGGLLVVGLYGLFQFIFAPPWDCLWLQAMEYDPASGPGVYGLAEPFGIRTFSTMNSHQPMAIVLIILALIALSKGERLYSYAAAIGMLPVVLSLARTAWLQAIVSLVLFAFLTRRGTYLKNLVAAVLVLGSIGVALSFTSFGETLQQRVLSFSDKGDDISVGARQAGYDKGLRQAQLHPFGSGTGAMEVAYTPVIYEDFGPNDSAVVELLVDFGVIGSVAILLALFIGLRQTYLEFRKTKDPLLAAILAIWAGLLVQSPLNSCLDGAHGVFVWACFALGLAYVKYTRNIRECDHGQYLLSA